jgi:very-short-patch-repair endonuclease
MPHSTLDALELRRVLRREQTEAERRLWLVLRDRRLGAKFRRQHSVGPYVLDFYCAEHRLAVELDGGQHFHPHEVARDAARTAYLRARGIRVIRFTNAEAFGDIHGMLSAIWRAIDGHRE